jgi:hypothetical protein
VVEVEIWGKFAAAGAIIDGHAWLVAAPPTYRDYLGKGSPFAFVLFLFISAGDLRALVHSG